MSEVRWVVGGGWVSQNVGGRNLINRTKNKVELSNRGKNEEGIVMEERFLIIEE